MIIINIEYIYIYFIFYSLFIIIVLINFKPKLNIHNFQKINFIVLSFYL